jgi:catechol 2,3-dioxygenase-like lactoylglutathione lyase family enzyme
MVMPLIKRINTILYCNKWEETITFYRERLGLKSAFQCDWFVEFRITPTAFLSVADQSKATLASAQGKGITLSFQIDHLRTAYNEFIRDGLAPTKIRANVMNADVFYLFDPEGNRLEFWRPK